MENQLNIQYKFLALTDLNDHFLKKFNRYQETYRVWYMNDHQFNVKDDYFIDEWKDEKKKEVIESLRECIKLGGAVVGAFNGCELVGFANIENVFFGSKNHYVELPYIHVSNEFRKHGIGRKMFSLCMKKAKQMGAKKLYIAAHPSIETQHFYRSVGCTYAAEINERIYTKEPLDIQLEVSL